MTTITETCACGASMTYTGPHPTRAGREFRESHKHAESVGICGDRAGWHDIPSPRPPSAPVCVLKAGHAGAHGDGDGAHWGYSGPETGLERPNGASGVSVDPDEDGRAL